MQRLIVVKDFVPVFSVPLCPISLPSRQIITQNLAHVMKLDIPRSAQYVQRKEPFQSTEDRRMIIRPDIFVIF
jgi:hypothetical protein